MRILGLDVGDRRIGVAISDPMGWTAQGLEVIVREDSTTTLSRLEEIINEYDVELMVVGIPRNMNGTFGEQCEKVKTFIDELKERFELPIIEWDERLSTVAAERSLLEADMRREKRKQVIDKVAAVLILQGYLDYASMNKK